MPGPIDRRFLYRENRVPHYQRLFQKNDGVRLWNKTPISKFLLYPYYVTLAGTLSGCMWMMGRMVLGHKTWWGKG